jgi:hypothetical protein
MGVLAVLIAVGDSNGGVAPMTAIRKQAALSGVQIVYVIMFPTDLTLSFLREIARKENASVSIHGCISSLGGLLLL